MRTPGDKHVFLVETLVLMLFVLVRDCSNMFSFFVFKQILLFIGYRDGVSGIVFEGYPYCRKPLYTNKYIYIYTHIVFIQAYSSGPLKDVAKVVCESFRS